MKHLGTGTASADQEHVMYRRFLSASQLAVYQAVIGRMTCTCIRHRTRAAALLVLMAAATLPAAAPVVVSGAQTKYGVTLKIAKKSELAKIRTYSWTPGQPAFDKTVNAQIRAAVDRELASRGLTKVESGPADVLATYYSLSRTDVDLKTKAPDGARPEYPVGTLVVDLLASTSRQPLFRVRVDQPISGDPARLESIINDAVAAMFEKYPARNAK
jgi:hypothetical protein